MSPFDEIDTYIPSDWVKAREGLDPLTGLATVVAEATKQGYSCVVDWEQEIVKVNSKTVRFACHEVDLAQVGFIKDGRPDAWIVVIPNNGGPGEWLCDYHCRPWLEKLIDQHCTDGR